MEEQIVETPIWTDIVTVGSKVSLRRTVSESDVYLFAGVTGDMHPNHIDQAYMAKGQFGQRVVHGALLIGLMSGASTKYALSRNPMPDSVSLGYDRVRFIAPAFFGDTITVNYEITEIVLEKDRAIASIEVRNQDDKLLAVAQHLTKYIR
jgi:Acyl dehydratase